MKHHPLGSRPRLRRRRLQRRGSLTHEICWRVCAVRRVGADGRPLRCRGIGPRRAKKEREMSNEPKGKKRIRVEQLKCPEQALAPEQADQASGGMADGSVRFVTGGTT